MCEVQRHVCLNPTNSPPHCLFIRPSLTMLGRVEFGIHNTLRVAAKTENMQHINMDFADFFSFYC